MQPFLSPVHDWRRPFWLGLLIVFSIAFTFAFACAVPFAAFAAATALTLRRRDAFILTLGIWLTNQLIGFFLMDYPWDANAFAWGAALGVIALAACITARSAAHHFSALNPLMCCITAFLAAFAAYEAGCYLFALFLGGVEDFTFAIQARIFFINACALALLFAVNRMGASLRLTSAYTLKQSIA